ncbi:hypothetical protein EVJ58_g6595 [Rhodofomes roseus]|uniref:Uncharacterized protein n=1 Tax=Rhodofomes roseus TaxID=34475 RepID=A0A4Y9Y8N6_9APHY|nr:hypothetical protein EVJ58_g6595 [Rhodofomes roseus]
MRPLTLHSSALNDAEYAVYIACLRDLAEDEPDMQASDTFYENMKVGVREARAWLRGRYSSLAPGMIDSILRLFCPSLAPADVLTGSQLFAVLRLVYHALNGRDIDKGLVFVQAHPDPQPSFPARLSIDRPPPPPPSYDPPSPDKNPFSIADLPLKSAPMVPSKSAPLPPAVPPKPSTNPFLARRGSEEGHRPSALGERERPPNPNARARSEGRTPPLPPRKPSIPVVPSLPPRHSSLAKMPETITPGHERGEPERAHPAEPPGDARRAEPQEGGAAPPAGARVGGPQEQQPVGLERPYPAEDTQHQPHEGPCCAVVLWFSGSDRRERLRDRPAPSLPPRRKLSPPASAISGSTTRSFESVARASIPTSLSRTRGVISISPSASACTSPTRTPPHPAT